MIDAPTPSSESTPINQEINPHIDDSDSRLRGDFLISGMHGHRDIIVDVTTVESSRFIKKGYVKVGDAARKRAEEKRRRY